MENLKDALEYAVDLKDGRRKNRNGVTTEKNGSTQKPTTCESWIRVVIRNRCELSSLTSLVEYIRKQLDETGEYANLIVHVTDHDAVEVKTELDDESRRRVFAVAKAITPEVRYDHFYECGIIQHHDAIEFHSAWQIPT